MRVVDRPAFRPGHCAAIPFLGPAGHPNERWVDTGAEMPGFDNHIYLSETAVVQAAQALGYPTRADVDKLAGELTDTRRELGEALAQVTALRTYKAAVAAIKAAK